MSIRIQIVISIRQKHIRTRICISMSLAGIIRIINLIRLSDRNIIIIGVRNIMRVYCEHYY